MGYTSNVMGVIATALIAVAAAPNLASDRTDLNRSATAPILIVKEGDRASFADAPIGRGAPQRTPALTVFAAAQPRSLSPSRPPDMAVSGRVYSAEPGHETVMLAELPWSLDARTGRMTTAIGIGVRNALAVRAGLSIEGHDAPIELRFVGSAEDSELVLDAPVTLGPGKNATVWSATLTGPVIVVELTRLDRQAVSPSGVLRVLHIVDVFDIGGPRSDVSSQKSSRSSVEKTAGDCFIDAVCETSVEYQSLAAAVTYLEVTKADGVYSCSGALINDTASSGRARVLTAGHCVDGALSITAYFGYRSLACNGASPSLLSLQRISASGTTMWNTDLDYGLIVYSAQAPDGTMLLGWDTRPLALGEDLVDIHHAGGGTQSLLWSRVAELRTIIWVDDRAYSLPRYESIYSNVGSRGGASGSNFVGRNPEGNWGIIRGILSFGALEADLAICPSDGTTFSRTANGAEFGQIYPGIQSELERPPLPTVSISANPTTITAGGSSTLTWSSANATSCAASGDWSGVRATSGSETTGPLSTTKVFTLTCTGSGGEASGTVIVSVTAPPVTVPNVLNQTQAAATTAINGAGLVVGAISQQTSATVPAGSVISQSPVPGTSVAAGSAVNLVVSTGPAPIPPPTVSLSASPASLTAGASGTLEWSTTNATACTASGGWSGPRTTSNSTQAIGPLFATTSFTLTCTGPGGTGSSSATIVVNAAPPGPVMATVPNVVNLTQAAATAAITGAGLVVGGVSQRSSTTVPAGSVISQDPAAGTSVTISSAVTLVVSSGPVAVPNVLNLTQAAATTVITGAGLALGAVSQQSSATVPSGNVISQNPAAGTSVAAGSAVALVVSTGPAPPPPPPPPATGGGGGGGGSMGLGSLALGLVAFAARRRRRS